ALSQDISILEELRRTLRQSQAGRALLDATLVRLALADQFASIGELLSRIDGTQGTPAPARSATRSAPPAQKKNLEGPGGVERRAPSASVGERVDQSAAPAPEQTEVARAGATESPSSADSDADGADDLPAPGKVWTGPSESLSSLMAKHRAASAAANPSPAPDVSSAPTQKVTGIDIASVDPTTLPAVWQAMLGILSSQGPMLHSLVSQGQLVGIDDGRLIIRFAPKHETFVKQWEKNGKRDLIRDAASQAMKQSVGVKFEIEADASAPAPTEAAMPVPAPAPAPAPRRSAPTPSAPAVESPQIPETPSVKVTNELVESLAAANPLIKAAIWKLGAQVIKVE
ncbi:MAG TPA: hypothetical protein VFC46_11175, partial [Humisphaera sp.]|nr:hypothetical protein [Humisphaera sp.]